MLFLNQRKRQNGRRNVFMTKSKRKNVPDVGIELRAACMPCELASDRATAPDIWQDKVLMNASKKFFRLPSSRLNYTYSYLQIQDGIKDGRHKAEYFFLRESLKFEKKLTCSYHVREDSVLMKGNQRDITNNIFSKFNCLRAAALGERETGTISGDNSKSSCTIMTFISAVCINFIFVKTKT